MKIMNANHSSLLSSALSILIFGFLLTVMQSSVFGQGDPELNQHIARLRAVTAKYHDLDTALADGFTLQPGGCRVARDGGGLGFQYINLPRFLSPEVDADEPEFMSYIPTDDGNMRLVGIAYTNRAFFRDTRPPETPGYRAGNFVWTQQVIPVYLEEVSGPFSLFGQEARRIFAGRWIYILSVWPWAPNPNGMFADGNPRLSCD
jgi:hypothetical protein